jgi:hypothetical protein
VVTSGGGLVLGPDGEPLEDSAPILAAITTALRTTSERAKLLGLRAPPKRRVDVITDDALTEAIRELEAEIAELESDD